MGCKVIYECDSEKCSNKMEDFEDVIVFRKGGMTGENRPAYYCCSFDCVLDVIREQNLMHGDILFYGKDFVEFQEKTRKKS